MPAANAALHFLFGNRPTILIHLEDGSLVCLDAVCTHLGCTVQFKPELNLIKCPCHGGTYDMQGQLTRNVAAPEPLQLVRGRWELQDANWYPDFPSSAQNAMWFYEQSGGPSVDGVMAINADLVARLIDAVGPIAMPKYNLTVDGETFLFETQRQVEIAYDRTANTPKAFIGDLAPVLLERLTKAQQDTFLNVVGLLGDGLSAQDIQIYHSDPSIQSAIERLGWDGGVRGNTGDYLMVTHANIGGGKTDSAKGTAEKNDQCRQRDHRRPAGQGLPAGYRFAGV